MILIATYDSAAQQNGEPRWHHKMPPGPQYWFFRMVGFGHDKTKAERTLRTKKPCTYHEMRTQLVERMLDEIREEVGGVERFQFWVYKAR